MRRQDPAARRWRRLGARLSRAGCWLIERVSEGSSQAAIAAAIVNASLTPPPASWICLALGLGQVLLPDGSLAFRRARRRRRRIATGNAATGRRRTKGEEG